jgi:hypothetical protein
MVAGRGQQPLEALTRLQEEPLARGLLPLGQHDELLEHFQVAALEERRGHAASQEGKQGELEGSRGGAGELPEPLVHRGQQELARWHSRLDEEELLAQRQEEGHRGGGAHLFEHPGVACLRQRHFQRHQHEALVRVGRLPGPPDVGEHMKHLQRLGKQGALAEVRSPEGFPGLEEGMTPIG